MAATIAVEVQLFARLREQCGNQPTIELELPAGADAASCFATLAERYPAIAGARDFLAVARNGDYASWDTRLEAGDVLAFIPPVSGGAVDRSPRRFAVVETPISAALLVELVAGPGNGAICTFEGTVRDHTGEEPTTHLEYEAYAEMAETVFGRIAAVAAQRHAIGAMAIHHRVGRLEIGEVSVAIAVSAPHRAAAFDACRYAIDQLKVSAPIWKKEFGPDGSYWVEGPTAADVEDGDRATGEDADAAAAGV